MPDKLYKQQDDYQGGGSDGAPEIDNAAGLGAGYAAGGAETTGVGGRPLGGGPVIDSGRDSAANDVEQGAAGDVGRGGSTTSAAGLDDIGRSGTADLAP